MKGKNYRYDSVFCVLIIPTPMRENKKNPQKESFLTSAHKSCFAGNRKCRNPFVSGISQCKEVAKEISVKNFKTESTNRQIHRRRDEENKR